jgi:hypothetical protein
VPHPALQQEDCASRHMGRAFTAGPGRILREVGKPGNWASIVRCTAVAIGAMFIACAVIYLAIRMLSEL